MNSVRGKERGRERDRVKGQNGRRSLFFGHFSAIENNKTISICKNSFIAIVRRSMIDKLI